jgi:hypothetical protein
MTTMSDEKKYGWDEPIEADAGGGWTVLPTGEYDFVIEGCEKKHNNKHDCPMPSFKVRLTDPATGASTTVTENVCMISTLRWKMTQICRATKVISPQDEVIPPRWYEKVVGMRGRAQVKVEKFDKRDGTKGEANRVDRYLEPATVPGDDQF